MREVNGHIRNRIFFYPDHTQYIILTGKALQHMYAHIQNRFWHKKAGGEIFVPILNIENPVIEIASGPNPQDKRSRSLLIPDPEAATTVRHSNYDAGLYPIGLWHTQPSVNPWFSEKSKHAARECLASFDGYLDRYILVVLGKGTPEPIIQIGVAFAAAEPNWIELIEETRREK